MSSPLEVVLDADISENQEVEFHLPDPTAITLTM